MAFSEFILIPVKSISPSVTCWTVKVQVSKLWKTVDHVNGKAIGKLEMILFDSEDDIATMKMNQLEENYWHIVAARVLVFACCQKMVLTKILDHQHLNNPTGPTE
ncbi:hypothetical protein JHK87_047577 [Glycine soja]|nr:hypothetical protein JHK87_047577 [Glycine soja]